MYLKSSKTGTIIQVPDSTGNAWDGKNGWARLTDAMAQMGSPAEQQASQRAAQTAVRTVPGNMQRLVGGSIIPAASMAASMAVPESAPLAPLLRIGASGAAAGAATPVAQAMQGLPMNPGDAALNAGLYSGAQSLGELAAPVMGMLRQAFGYTGYRPTAQMLAKNPEAVQQAISMRAPVNAGGAPVSMNARDALREAANEVNGSISRAQAAGVKVPFAELTNRLNALRAKTAAGDPTGDAVAAVDDFIAKFQKRWNPSGAASVRPVAVQALKKENQDVARVLLSKEGSTGLSYSAGAKTGQAAKAVAQDARQALGSRIPGLNDANQAKLQAGTVISMLQRAPTAGLPFKAEAALPALAGLAGGLAGHGTMPGLESALVMHLLTQPQVASRIAIGLDNPFLRSLAAQSPRALLYLLQASQSPDTTGATQ